MLVFPLLAVTVIILWHGIPDRLLDGDAALLEMSTQAVLDGEQLTGPYSRNGFNHPGPVYFYVLAPLYALAHGRAFSLYLTVAGINMAALIGALAILRRMTDWRIAAWGALMLALYSRQLGSFLYDIWNPWVTILPFIVSVLAFAAAANGAFRFFPVGIAVSSFVVQSHLGYTLVIVVMAAYALVLEFCPSFRHVLGLKSQRKPRHRLPALGASLAVLIVLWAAPILEEIQGIPGNITKIIAFFARSTPELSRQQAWQTFYVIFSYFVGNLVSSKAPLTLLEPGFFTLINSLVVGGQSVLLLFAWILARRWRQPYLASLALMVGLSCLTIFLSIHRIVGGLLGYLVVWMTVSGVLCWMVIGGVFLHALSISPLSAAKTYFRDAFTALIVVGLMVVTILSFHEMFANITDDIANKNVGTVTPQLLQITAQTLEFLENRNIVRPVLRTLDYHLWPTAAGLGLQFTKRQRVSTIDPQYPTIYPSRYAPTGQEEGMLLIGTSRTASLLKKNPGMRVVTEVDDRAVLWRSFTDGLDGEYLFELLPAFAKAYQGFSKPGYNPDGLSYRWASASESSLEIPLSQGIAHQITVSMTIRAPIRDVEILWNRQLLLTIPGPQEWGWRDILVDIPAEDVQPLNTVTFRYLYDSRDTGADFEKKQRSVAFKSLTVKKISARSGNR